jgi:hypothetical protein
VSVQAPFKQTERQFERAIVEYAKLSGWKAFHPFDSRRSEPGWPDLTLVRDAGSWRVEDVKAIDCFAGYMELRGSLPRWPRSPGGPPFLLHEQREIIGNLIRTLFAVWDEKEALKQRLASLEAGGPTT